MLDNVSVPVYVTDGGGVSTTMYLPVMGTFVERSCWQLPLGKLQLLSVRNCEPSGL